MKKMESIIESLLTHIAEYFGLGWEEDAEKSIDILFTQFNARIR
jgi:hypothetical protein